MLKHTADFVLMCVCVCLICFTSPDYVQRGALNIFCILRYILYNRERGFLYKIFGSRAHKNLLDK